MAKKPAKPNPLAMTNALAGGTQMAQKMIQAQQEAKSRVAPAKKRRRGPTY